jgi:tRNA-Thr(GGU) m(6)t(6)A37 methyltransferase TsaA
MTMKSPNYELHPIGYVRRSPQSVHLEIAEPFRPGLKQLEHFSHVIVVWWADQHDNAEDRSTMQCYPPYAPSKLTGVFACRAEYRPNPIAITTCKVSELDEEQGILGIHSIDAFDGTPILDLKGYFPVCDRVKEARVPEWTDGWGEWMPDEGLGLEY